MHEMVCNFEGSGHLRCDRPITKTFILSAVLQCYRISCVEQSIRTLPELGQNILITSILL